MLTHLVPQCLGDEGECDAALPHHLRPQVLHTRLEWILQVLETRLQLIILTRSRHQQRPHHHQVVHPQLPVCLGVVEHRVDLAELVLHGPGAEYCNFLDVLEC